MQIQRHLVVHDGAQTHDADVNVVRRFPEVHLRVGRLHPRSAVARHRRRHRSVPRRLTATSQAAAPRVIVVHSGAL